jgi:hypothetical protein
VTRNPSNCARQTLLKAVLHHEQVWLECFVIIHTIQIKVKDTVTTLGYKMTQIININASKENMETGEPLRQSQLTLILGIG